MSSLHSLGRSGDGLPAHTVITLIQSINCAIPLIKDVPQFTSWDRCYNRRSFLERINSRLDNDFCFEKHYIRSRAKMQTRMGLSLVVIMAMALGHIKEGRKAQIRSLVRPLSKAA
jgi:hypothetical protein